MIDRELQIAFAKLEALLDRAETLMRTGGRYYKPSLIYEYYDQFASARDKIIEALPELYDDFPIREKPESSDTSDFDGEGRITHGQFELIVRDIKQILKTKNLVFESQQNIIGPPRVFISHGNSEGWREVQSYIERDIGLETLELAQEANRGRTVLQKLEEESNRCSYAVVVMTGDDRTEDGTVRARENVMHEIGFFQGKFGLPNVCLLYEEGTNIPSNIHGLVYIPFPSGMVKATFGDLTRELNAAFPEDETSDG